MAHHIDRGPRPAVGAGLFAVLAFPLLVLLLGRYDAPTILAIALLVAALVPLLVWPELATLAVLFLFYTNLPTLATQLHGVPKFAAASFILLLALPLTHYVFFRREPLRADPVFLLMLGYLGGLLLSALFARDASIAAGRIQTFVLEGLILYWLIVNVIRRWAGLRRVIWTLLAAGALLGGLSLYQAVSGSYQQSFGGLAQREMRFEMGRGDQSGIVEFRVSNRAGGPLGDGDPNRYAQIMLVLLPLAMFQLRSAGSRRARMCAAGLGILILSGILLSYSRGAFVTLTGLLLAATFVRWMKPGHLLSSFLVAGILVALVAPTYYERIASVGAAASLVQDGNTAEADGSIRGRATEMLAALNVFIDHPVVGVGPGQYTPFYSMEYQQDSDIKFRDLRRNRRAHILYFELAAETGIIGLALFFSIVAVLLRELWRSRRFWASERPEFSDLATAFFLSICAYLGTAVFLHLSYERYYWLLIALAAAALQVLRSEEFAIIMHRHAGEPADHHLFTGSTPRVPTPSISGR